MSEDHKTCDARKGNFWCTLSKNHKGNHIAKDEDDEIVEEWV